MRPFKKAGRILKRRGLWAFLGLLVWGAPTRTFCETAPVRFAMVGDIMTGSDHPGKEWAHPDPYALLAPAAGILSNADLAMGNMEGALASTASPVIKKGKNSYAFRMPPLTATAFAKAGFDVLNLANNHAYDAGYSGVVEATNLLMAQGVQAAGLKGLPVFVKVRGLVVGVVGFSPYSHHDNFLEESAARVLIRSAAARCQILVVTMHAGAEGEQAVHVPRTNEFYYGENRGDVYRFAHLAVDEGAALVFAHGPHVLRGLEIYKDHLIAYSLGNFVGHRQFNVMGAFGVSCVLEASLDERGRFLGGLIHPFLLSVTGPSLPDPERKAVNLMKLLSEKDFPDAAPLFSEGGKISPRPPAK